MPTRLTPVSQTTPSSTPNTAANCITQNTPPCSSSPARVEISAESISTLLQRTERIERALQDIGENTTPCQKRKKLPRKLCVRV